MQFSPIYFSGETLNFRAKTLSLLSLREKVRALNFWVPKFPKKVRKHIGFFNKKEEWKSEVKVRRVFSKSEMIVARV